MQILNQFGNSEIIEFWSGITCRYFGIMDNGMDQLPL